MQTCTELYLLYPQQQSSLDFDPSSDSNPYHNNAQLSEFEAKFDTNFLSNRNNRPDPPISTIQIPNTRITSLVIMGSSTIFVNEHGEVLKSENWHETIKNRCSNPGFSILEANFPWKIKSLSCNASVIHAISVDGNVFSWGKDENFSGILGLGRIYSQKTPALNLGFNDCKIREISIGQKHVGAITENGSVYLWGSGVSGEIGNFDGKTLWEPKMLENSELDNQAIGVDCHNSCTSIIIESGSLFLLGSLRKERKQKGFFRISSRSFRRAIILEKMAVALNSREQ